MDIYREKRMNRSERTLKDKKKSLWKKPELCTKQNNRLRAIISQKKRLYKYKRNVDFFDNDEAVGLLTNETTSYNCNEDEWIFPSPTEICKEKTRFPILYYIFDKAKMWISW